jgi:trehalose-phosphatase
VIIERKRYSVAVHHRMVASAAVVAEIARVVEGLRASSELRVRAGKKVFELEPAVDWNKGRALRWIADTLAAGGPARPFVVYVGDDETDEDAFAGLAGDGAGVRVGEVVASSLADYRVADPGAVRELLRRLAP